MSFERLRAHQASIECAPHQNVFRIASATTTAISRSA
jgi:hypothetical protein